MSNVNMQIQKLEATRALFTARIAKLEAVADADEITQLRSDIRCLDADMRRMHRLIEVRRAQR